MTVYRVVSRQPYRGHPRHDLFEADLNPSAEARALARGAIEVVERSTPSLQPGSVHLPDGWPNQQEE